MSFVLNPVATGINNLFEIKYENADQRYFPTQQHYVQGQFSSLPPAIVTAANAKFDALSIPENKRIIVVIYMQPDNGGFINFPPKTIPGEDPVKLITNVERVNHTESQSNTVFVAWNFMSLQIVGGGGGVKTSAGETKLGGGSTS